MKLNQEKVKDIVEVRDYESLRDFTADPAKTLLGYHFTDVTSELMAKWLDRIAEVRPGSGCAMALAGYRGVGKSHFLAALSALVSHPELRNGAGDAHVAASAGRLLRRHYPVAYVRRGVQATLIDEFRLAMAETLGTPVEDLPQTASGILGAAVKHFGELPFVLVIDTAFERGSRVARDDGATLAEIGEAAKAANVFLGIALDDDIAGADGPNSAISRTFTIDYLDQEHLYKVVNSSIFPKQAHRVPVLRDVYSYFRAVLPSFRWSEQKFTALYPLHPAILEVAPFVRLYVHDFALLGFASAAGERILGRPANSLIGLDEVFDSAEKGLRQVEDLHDTFAAYDKLNAEVVSKIPVMQRLQAKLILKALLLLSLEGQGTTAAEISAAMLIFDEQEPEKAVSIVDEFVKKFAEALPGDIQISIEPGREPRYGFKVASKDNLNLALAAKAESIAADTVVPRILRNLVIDRFSDCEFSTESVSGDRTDLMDCSLTWRGGLRRGRIFWADADTGDLREHCVTSESMMDWEVYIDAANGATEFAAPAPEVSRVIWKPDPIRPDEIDTIVRYYILSTDEQIRAEFSEQLRASLHAHAVSVEKIFNRLFLEDGKLVIDGFDYNCTEEARSAATLSGLFSIMLEPLFETRFPSHPVFGSTLGMDEVSSLAANFYGGLRQNLNTVQAGAQAFALPLGLVREQDGQLVGSSAEELTKLPLIDAILQLVHKNDQGTVRLRAVYSELSKEPYGLTREAQHLLLTALVAARKVEFVTSKGDRIGHRSLDLKIIWDDIVGIAPAKEAPISSKRIARWASIIGGTTEGDLLTDKDALRGAFETWHADWRNRDVIKKFGELPDHIFTTQIWRIAARVSKTLGAVAENIAASLDGSLTLEEALGRIADVFSDSEERYALALGELAIIESFTAGAVTRAEIRSYLSGCDLTGVRDLDETRDLLAKAVNTSAVNPSDASNREMGYLWTKFRRDYADHFAAKHDSTMRSSALEARYSEVLRSDLWWDVENLSSFVRVDPALRTEVDGLRNKLADIGCKFETREALNHTPRCFCSFSLADADDWNVLPEKFAQAVGSYAIQLRRSLFDRKDEILAALKGAADSQLAADWLASADLSRPLTRETVAALARVLKEPLQNWPEPPDPSKSEAETTSDTTHTGSPVNVLDENLVMHL